MSFGKITDIQEGLLRGIQEGLLRGIQEGPLSNVREAVKMETLSIVGGMLLATNAMALDELPRLQNTGNVAADLNNPANLVVGKKGNKANGYAIGYVKTRYKKVSRKFLVFCTDRDGYSAMRASISQRQEQNPDRPLSELIDLWVTGKWKIDLKNNGWVGGTSARGNYQKTFLKTIKTKFSPTYVGGVSMETKFSKMNTHVIAMGLAGAEGFKGGNDKYKNSPYCKLPNDG